MDVKEILKHVDQEYYLFHLAKYIFKGRKLKIKKDLEKNISVLSFKILN